MNIEQTAAEQTVTEQATELPPELSALEASFAAVEPAKNRACLERTKAAALLDICRQYPPQENLVETILNAGEERITVSLRQYLRTERLCAGLVGVVVGLLLGTMFFALGLLTLFVLPKIL